MNWEPSKNSKEVTKLLQQHPDWRLREEVSENGYELQSLIDGEGNTVCDNVHRNCKKVLEKCGRIELVETSELQIVRTVNVYRFIPMGELEAAKSKIISLEKQLRVLAEELESMRTAEAETSELASVEGRQ